MRARPGRLVIIGPAVRVMGRLGQGSRRGARVAEETQPKAGRSQVPQTQAEYRRGLYRPAHPAPRGRGKHMGLPVTRLFWKYPGTGDLSVGECPKIVRGRKSVGCVGLMDNHRHARTRTGICRGTYTSYTPASNALPCWKAAPPTSPSIRSANLPLGWPFPRPALPFPSAGFWTLRRKRFAATGRA